ncbi:hypothetical protein CANINC_001338 [Pichia inconspicua]|uniref:Uncharacterized protein n=1 Tax=Pichia inconspicua TaxID=52247 RepID=A0A4T0X529_9ASCO|nr:hypothetical protein CANINC_001338 [[Candida] inconspicua]
METKDIKKIRNERFNKTHDDWGLVSRGENKLKSFNERRKLEKQLKQRVTAYIVGDDNERDSILMGYRKLREGVLSNGDKTEYIRIYLDSAHFAVNFGEQKDYLPILWALYSEKIDYVTSALALHLTFIEEEYERSFQIVNSADVEKIIQSWVCGNIFKTYWLLKKLPDYGNIRETAITIVEDNIRKGIIAYRGKEVELYLSKQFLQWEE